MKFNGLEKNRQTSQTRELKSKSVKRPKIPIPNKKIVRWCSEESDFVTIMDGLQKIEYAKQCYQTEERRRAAAGSLSLLLNLAANSKFVRHTLQGSVQRWSLGLVNFVTALAYRFCLTLPAALTQPGDHISSEPCTFSKLLVFFYYLHIESSWHWRSTIIFVSRQVNAMIHQGHTSCFTICFTRTAILGRKWYGSNAGKAI